LPELTTCTFHSVHSFTHEGRAIRRLVDLVIPLRDLIAEHDRRLELGAEDEVSADAIQSSTECVLFFFSFLKTKLNPLSSVLKGGLYLPLVQEAGPLVPLGPKIVKFRGRLRHVSGTSRGKIRQHSVISLLMRNCFLKLKIGADGGRADNTGRLKVTVANWLNNAQQRPDPLLRPEDKLRRGFSHDVTGRLLCPVDYDWVDPSYASLIYQLVNGSF